MDLFLVIAQGVGLAVACGVRPFLPVLVAGALAGADRGVDFEGTAYAFLESVPFLAAAALGLVGLIALERTRGGPAVDATALTAAVGGLGIGLGGLEFAGSLADVGRTAWIGLAAGVACAALAQGAARSLFGRVAQRLDPEARGALVVYLEGTALVLAAVAILLPPLSLLGLVAAVVLLVRGRARGERKYAGLRVLR
jgi:hypothetical protein